MGRLLGRIWVGFTICLIAFIAYSSQIFIIWPWYGRELSVDLLTLLLPFNFLVGMIYWNYYLAVTTDPGRVPRGWSPDTHSEEGYEVKPLTGNPRYCRMCDGYKPPRTHHCRQCRRCVLRMDHHCPWVNNCIGHYNHGHFIRFLFFVDVACSYHLAMVTKRTIDAMNARYWEGPDTVEFIFMILNYVTCGPVLLAVGGFSLYHFYCLSSNTTTIESWEKDKVATLVKRGKIHEVKFPYNIGKRANLESVLGKNPLLWCCPSAPPGDGLKFRVIETEDGEARPWPPEDPNNRAYDFNHDPDDDDYELDLPASPWTYENGSVNPSLEPSNAFRRRAAKANRRARQAEGVSNVPPYHPDYGKTSATSYGRYPKEEDEESDSDECRYYEGRRRVRRGSEGYEVQMSPTDRETILRRYMWTRGEEVGRYKTYKPETPSASSSSSPGPQEQYDDDLPLGAEANVMQS
ncbi:PFA4 [Sanghuangporus vaninii]